MIWLCTPLLRGRVQADRGAWWAGEAALKAADQLITRFHEKGEFIQAWGP